MQIKPDERSFLTYAEYKLFCYINNKKPLDKSKTGLFINKNSIHDLFDSPNLIFNDKNILDFIEVLFVDKKLSSEKIKEISTKIGFDENELFPIFEKYENMAIDERLFSEFVNNI